MNSLKSRFFACILSTVLPAAGAHAGELTFTSWGGSYAKAQLDTAVTPFSRSTGVKTRMEEYAGGLDELRRQVNSGNVTWDVVDLTLADARFPGKRGLRRTAQGNLEFALMADGVPVDKVYAVLSTPAGVDRAFRKLDALKAHIVWWTAGAEPVEMLESGKVHFASAYNGRIYAASMRGNKPLRYLWDGQLLSLDGLGIVKGTRNRKDALDFVRYASSPPAMAALAPLTAYGPTRASAAGLLDAVMMHVLPTAHWYAKRSLTVDARWWSTHGEALEQRFTAWAGK
jgi:spermidine/putrescine-binding protein